MLSLGKLSDVERDALAGLLDRRHGMGTSMRIAIADLDAALHNGGPAESLRDALEKLHGPIANRRTQRAITQQQRDGERAACVEPRLAALMGNAIDLGLLKRVAGGDPDLAGRLCMAAQRVLGQLPAKTLARSHLAANLLGDAHAPDQGRPVPCLVLAALRRHGLSQTDMAQAADSQIEVDETTREIWAGAAGVVFKLDCAKPAGRLRRTRLFIAARLAACAAAVGRGWARDFRVRESGLGRDCCRRAWG